MLFRNLYLQTLTFVLFVTAGWPVTAEAADFEPLRLVVQGKELPEKIQALSDGREVYLPLDALSFLEISFVLDRREETAELKGREIGPASIALARIRGRPMVPLSALLGPCKLDRTLEAGRCELWSKEAAKPPIKKPDAPSAKPLPASSLPASPAKPAEQPAQQKPDVRKPVVEPALKTEPTFPEAPPGMIPPVQGPERLDPAGSVTPGPPATVLYQPMGLAKPSKPSVSLTDVVFVSMNATHAQVQIRTFGKPLARTRLLFDPTRLEVDLSNTVPTTEGTEWVVDHPFVEKIAATAGDLSGTTRLTLALKQMIAYQQLEPSADGVVLNLSLPRGAGRKFEDIIVVVDAGHGGHDTGCQSKSGGVCTNEKDLTLSIARTVARLIGSAGATAILTRDSDVFIPLKERPAVATRNNADLFVSIHINSCKVPNTASGSSTYFHKTDTSSRALAQSILGRIVRVSGLPSYGALSDRTLYANGLAVLRHSTVPSTLVEVAFLNNARDRKLLRTEAFRNRIAQAVVDGIRGYVESSLPDDAVVAEASDAEQSR